MNDTQHANTLAQVRENAAKTADALDQLANVLAERPDFSVLTARARARARELRANKFILMVLGEFKRGKSTVINAMLGARAMPTKPAPCTAITTFVRYGESPKARITFKDGDVRELSLEDYNSQYQLHVDETGSQAFEVQSSIQEEITDRFGSIDHAEIQYPSRLLEDGVELVDTPGMNESNVRTRRVFERLRSADAIIMVLDAITVCNQNEMQFIDQRLRPLGLHKHVFFLIIDGTSS